MPHFIIAIFERDLLTLKKELNNYRDEANIWKTAPGITNCAGNLTLHLIGNLNHFIGATLGHTGYVRHRDSEFTNKDVPRETLIAELDQVIAMINNVIGSLTDEQLASNYPLELFGVQSTSFYLTHLFGHLNYHLGQINYLRRFLEQ